MRTRGPTMKIIVLMDARGEIWAHHEQGNRREVCFFKTDEETEEELRGWGYPLLGDAYPNRADRSGAGYGTRGTGRVVSGALIPSLPARPRPVRPSAGHGVLSQSCFCESVGVWKSLNA